MSAKPSMVRLRTEIRRTCRRSIRLRPDLGSARPAVHVEPPRTDGTIYLRPEKRKLLDYPRAHPPNRLHHWAAAAPDRVFMAERNAARGWAADHLCGAARLLAAHRVRACWRAAFSAEKPVVILSGKLDRSCADRVQARSMPAFPSVRYRRPIRLVSRDYGKPRLFDEAVDRRASCSPTTATKFADALAANVSLSATENPRRSARRPCPGRDVHPRWRI